MLWWLGEFLLKLTFVQQLQAELRRVLAAESDTSKHIPMYSTSTLNQSTSFVLSKRYMRL